MIKCFIRIAMMDIACIIDVIAMLLILDQWLGLKSNKIKTIIYILIGLGILLACLMFFSHTKYVPKFSNAIKILEIISIFIFLIGAASAVAKISFLGIERGSTAYFIYSYPALLPLLSNLMCLILSGNK